MGMMKARAMDMVVQSSKVMNRRRGLLLLLGLQMDTTVLLRDVVGVVVGAAAA